MNPRLEQRGRGIGTITVPTHFTPGEIAGEQVKAVISMSIASHGLKIIKWRNSRTRQEIADQSAPRGRIGTHFGRRPIIRQRSETAVTRDTKPRATAAQVAPSKQARHIFPPLHGKG